MDKFFSRAPKEDDSDGTHTDFSEGSSRKKKKSRKSSKDHVKRGSRKPEGQENAGGNVVGDDVLPHSTADLKQPDTVEFKY